jgi:two-component system LytT family response regulator
MTNSVLKIVIVDDEPLARDRVRDLLKFHRDVKIVGEARNGQEAIQTITLLQPDIVFLDVQMPDMDGFEVLKSLDSNSIPLVIFVTAFDEYALRAFEFHALDYLMKPFDRERFTKAINHAKLQAALSKDRDTSHIIRLLEDIKPRAGYLERFVIKAGETVHFVRASEVDSIEAEGNYVRLKVGNAAHLLRDTLNNIESQIDPQIFVRIHRSTIVNMNRVRELQTWARGEYRVILHSGASHTLSRGYREHFESVISRPSAQ